MLHRHRISRLSSQSKTRVGVRSVVLAAQGTDKSHDTDVVVIGSGIGGLSCAALLAKYGVKVMKFPRGPDQQPQINPLHR